MLLQTNSYIVPKEKRSEHARLMRRFRQALGKLGCDQFEIYEQVGPNWSGNDTSGRFVQLMRFRDRKHQVAVQTAERNDPAAQALISEFCELVNFPYQQQQGYFAVGFYTSVLSGAAPRSLEGANAHAGEAPAEAEPVGPAESEASAAAEFADEPPEIGHPPGADGGSEAAPGEDVLDLNETGEPLGEEELERQLENETPSPAPPAPERTGLFRRK